MNDAPPPPTQPNPEDLLLREVYLQAIDTLRDILPPPRIDTVENRDRRTRVALVKVAALVPANPVEADLAAYHVAAMAQVAACTRQAGHAADPKRAAQLRAQASSQGREARGYVAKLLSVQGTRRKREATNAGCSSAAMTEHAVHGLLVDALESLPPEEVAAPEVTATPASDASAASPAATSHADAAAPPAKKHYRDYSEWSDEEKLRDRQRWEADRWVILNTVQAQRIRQCGGMPPDADFEAPPPEILHIIVTSNSLNMQWVDNYVPWKPPVE